MHKYPRGNGQRVCEIVLPEKLAIIEDSILKAPKVSKAPKVRTSTSSSSMSSYKSLTKESSLKDVTEKLIGIYKDIRLKIFHDIGLTKPCMFGNEFFRRYGNQCRGKMAKKRVLPSLKSRNVRKIGNFTFDETKMRTPEEREEELKRIRAFLDKMIEASLKDSEKKRREREAAGNNAKGVVSI